MSCNWQVAMLTVVKEFEVACRLRHDNEVVEICVLIASRDNASIRVTQSAKRVIFFTSLLTSDVSMLVIIDLQAFSINVK